MSGRRITRVALVVHEGKPAAGDLESRLRKWIAGRDLEAVDERADLVLSLGGDGTMLRAAQVAHEWDAPLLGVNLGTLGYLTEVDAPGAQAALERVVEGDFEIQERMMLACDVSGAGAQYELIALNEVLVERAARHRLVRLGVEISGESLTDFNADGVIVATPTGSTAYALSAGGPIVSPAASCIVLVPVNAHIIFARPFVLDGSDTVAITVRDGNQAATLSLDGAMGRDLPPGARVLVRRHERPLKLVRVGGPRFLDRLRAKLGLPG